MVIYDSVEYRNEIAKVREIQAFLLPDFKLVNGFEVDYSYLPANDISGDFFDGFFISDDIYQIILCDVSGHGMASAYVGNGIRAIFRLYSSAYNSMVDTARFINKILVEELSGLNYYCTAIMCRIYIKTGMIEYLNAGHPPAIIHKTQSGASSLISSSGSLIGLFEDNEYKTDRLFLKKNDYLLLYTDGISEAAEFDKIHEKGMFGTNRVMETFSPNPGLTSKDIIFTLINRVYEFTEYTTQMDDMTAICLRKI